MSAVRFRVMGAGFKGGVVGSAEAGLIGCYHDGKPYRPDASGVRALLPYRWRAAFDRDGKWWQRDDAPLAMWSEVRSTRGRHLTTIYAYSFVTEDKPQ